MPKCAKILVLNTIYKLLKLLTTLLTIFCVITDSNSFISDLSYTSCNSPSLRSNLNYKQLLKRVNISNFLRANLNNKKAKDPLNPSPYLFPT